MSEHPLFCFTHRQFGCAQVGGQNDCEFVTAVGLCDRIDTLTAENEQSHATLKRWMEQPARREVESLRTWKAEATAVIAAWEQSYDALDAAGHPAALGEFKFDHVLRWIKTVLSERA